jgi:hypothetical protein
VNDYDRRQLALMGSQLESYREGQLDLAALIQRLEGLLNALEAVDPAWKEAFHEEWFTLEQVFAVSLDRPGKNVIGDSKKILEEALGKLSDLVREPLERMREPAPDD